MSCYEKKKQVWGIKDEYFEKVYPKQEKKKMKRAVSKSRQLELRFAA